jgi:Protein of unknown function (DUF742)
MSSAAHGTGTSDGAGPARADPALGPPTQVHPAQADPARIPPYLLTGGRARPADESLELEAQVVATAAGREDLARLHFEPRDIVRLCENPYAVAEVAARLGLHLGVTRILVGDLVLTGHLSVRRPEHDAHLRADIIERVIRGLDAIT